MNRNLILQLCIIVIISFACGIKDVNSPLTEQKTASTGKPPMGWNSWNCFGIDVKEDQVRAAADYMSEYLKDYGWEYIVVDMGWYGGEDFNTQTFKMKKPPLFMDDFGRLIPSVEKFPSASDGRGFKSLGDYVHSKGLKIGIHIMRGIPWEAVEKNTPILNTGFHAADITEIQDSCSWFRGMVGINMTKPGAQEYYNSLAKLYAEWGIDFIKADDMSRPYHTDEIKGLSQALKTSGRDIILSLSPGESPVQSAKHLTENSNMWRISDDFWDDWRLLKKQFALCSRWTRYRIDGHWPDCDMLILGKLRITGPDNYTIKELNRPASELTNEYSRFTTNEKYTMMNLWSIFRSPLMIGGYLPENDSLTLMLLTNKEVIAVNQNSTNNREIFSDGEIIIWTADIPDSEDKYYAIFNIGEDNHDSINITRSMLKLTGDYSVTDLWQHSHPGKINNGLNISLKPHASYLFRFESLRYRSSSEAETRFRSSSEAETTSLFFPFSNFQFSNFQIQTCFCFE